MLVGCGNEYEPITSEPSLLTEEHMIESEQRRKEVIKLMGRMLEKLTIIEHYLDTSQLDMEQILENNKTNNRSQRTTFIGEK